MIFAAQIGHDHAAWRDAVSRHARRLGLPVREGDLALADGRAIRFAWLGPAPAASPDPRVPPANGALVLATSGDATPAPDVRNAEALARLLADPAKPAATRVGVLPAAGEVIAAVPPAAVEQLYFARVGGGWVVSNDLRLMAGVVGGELDEAGVLGLFRYGLTPAPLTLFRGVGRVPVGHLLRMGPGAEIALVRFAVLGDASHREPGAADPAALIRETLDAILRRAPQSPVVYFSGGVDSSLIAARLAALGRDDAILVNYAFGPDDPKARLARRIAQHLGLRLHQVAWNPADIPAVLERLGRDYPFPFCDTALIPGNLLAHAAMPLARSSRTTMHGVGAGALFGQRLHIRRLWRPLGWIPAPVRRALAWPYGALRLWRQDSDAVRLCEVLQRSAHVPLIHAMMAEHPMEGIAYAMPPETGRTLDAAIRDYVEPLAAGRDYDLLTSVLHQMYFTSREFSAVVLGPQMAAGVDSIAPFMEPLMMQRGFALTWDEKRPGGVPKGLLRNLLAAHLPADLAWAAGGSFLAPRSEIYAHPAMRALVEDTALAADNPLLDYCRADTVRAMLMRLVRGESLAASARKFAWAFIFASAWLRQTRSEI
ncbi:MAG: hypothetical protein Kow00123_16890 [Anaerolineales bacterium]